MSNSETTNTLIGLTTASVASSNTGVATDKVDSQTPESTLVTEAQPSIVETDINKYPDTVDSSQDADSDDEYTPRAPKDHIVVKTNDGTKVKVKGGR
ncbi:hypothetical protein M422DRAFT_780055 [Sphaerobolus stellatus SS14]|uniref:Uncharacterized protein n=1 Tax=Sphaerobolus stellatus (strain SS14) TaxID=990650 RepID=A0A0C9TPW8_SPHS4|nr:hypothetical protein M422DRAFT_786006 [Sphaerobolus stellatus SS14]KIJ42247.1 hypothetical protein M422DRAFT_780055 [Sphaerobolus stellatus SS14]